MPRPLRVEVVSASGGDKTPGSWLRVSGRLIKYALFAFGAYCLWHYIGQGAGKAKYHGALLTPVATLLALQEFLFFNARAKLGEALRSPAIQLRELEKFHARVKQLKAYADRLWYVALPSKITAMILGATLFLGGNPVVMFTVKGHAISGDALMGVFGWFAVLVGLDLTWRTFRLFKHVDARLAELEVDARKLSANKEALKEFNAAAEIAPPAATVDEDYTRTRALRPRPIDEDERKS